MPAQKKIHLVHATVACCDPGTAAASPQPSEFLVRAFTKAGAERHVSLKFKPDVIAKVPSQDELLAANGRGVVIEEAE